MLWGPCCRNLLWGPYLRVSIPRPRCHPSLRRRGTKTGEPVRELCSVASFHSETWLSHPSLPSLFFVIWLSLSRFIFSHFHPFFVSLGGLSIFLDPRITLPGLQYPKNGLVCSRTYQGQYTSLIYAPSPRESEITYSTHYLGQ